MPLNPLIILLILLLAGMVLFVLLASGFEALVKLANDHRYEGLMATLGAIAANWMIQRHHAEHWQVWSEENGYTILTRKRAWFKPGVHKLSWLLKDVWFLTIQVGKKRKEVWVATDRGGYPTECKWLESNEKP